MKAAFEATAPPTFEFSEEGKAETKSPAAVSSPSLAGTTAEEWDAISKKINTQIESAENILGAPLSATAKGEIVGTVLAGSDVLGVSTIYSPLLMGAALGYASTHVLGGKHGEALSKASMDAVTQAASFAQTQLEEEHRGISKASARILEAAKKEAINKLQKQAKLKSLIAQKEISTAPKQSVQGVRRRLFAPFFLRFL